jgi:hypothetical protein
MKSHYSLKELQTNISNSNMSSSDATSEQQQEGFK